MAIEVIMPKAGMDMQEGQIAAWNKSVGDYVEKGEILLEIVTDKVNMEVEAEESGYLLKILKQEGEVVPVITTIAYLGEKDEKLDLPSVQENIATEDIIKNSEEKIAKAISKNCCDTAQSIEKSEFSDKVRATPKARKYSSDNEIDLNLVKGTQERGRICYNDVVDYDKNSTKFSPVAKNMINSENIEIPSAYRGSGIAGKVMKSDVLEFMNSGLSAEQENTSSRSTKIVKMNNMRSVIAKRMKQSYLESPVVHYYVSVNMQKAMNFIEENKFILQESYGIKLSVNDLILMICARVLMKHPHLNGSVDEEKQELIFHNYVDLAMAVGLDDGLLTPIIRNAHIKSLSEIAIASREISQKARNMKLSTEELSGSTFTISNIGMFGIESFTPIINQPNTAILGIGTIVKTPYVVDDKIEITPIMQLSLSADHRISDGVVAAKFMQDLKKMLENPMLILI